MKSKRVFNGLRLLGYGFVFVGTYLAFDLYSSHQSAQAVKIFAIVGILPLSLCAFLWHTVTKGHIIDDQKSAFFEIECGGANLGIGVALLVAWFSGASIEVFHYILMIYFVYLLIGSICHFFYRGIKHGLFFLPVLATILFFIILSF